MSHRKKLIDVALPIEVINSESKRDKGLSSGHPTTLHYWWAPRPLPACRAVVFASLVDDPSEHPDRFPTEESQKEERQRLFSLMERLVQWESRRDTDVLGQARKEIEKSTNGAPPTLLDPFCGRGLIPLEGQRLGLDVIAADLNPVAAAIAKVLLEVIPEAVGKPPVNPEAKSGQLVQQTEGLHGFLLDTEYYAREILDQARPEIEQHFPTYRISDDVLRGRPDLAPVKGQELPVMGYLWARTAQCSNPSCNYILPLVGSLWLSKKKGKKYWLVPEPDPSHHRINFQIRTGSGSAPDPTKLSGTSGSFRCPACGEISDDRHIALEGEAGRIGQQLLACIADGGRSVGRVYLPPNGVQEAAADAQPGWRPEMPLPDYSQAMPTVKHGAKVWADLFSDRQLKVLNTLSEKVQMIRDETLGDVARARSRSDGWAELTEKEAQRYADGIAYFLALVLGKYANRSSAFCFWDSGSEKIQQPFAHQGIQKTWDFVETNPFSGASGSWESAFDYPLRVVRESYTGVRPGKVLQRGAQNTSELGNNFLIITDPPYYDNVGYADLSDYFYIWMRKALKDISPAQFGTVLTPKTEEIAAVRHRFDGKKQAAEEFFISSFQRAAEELAKSQHDDYPLCLFYAYKQKERPSGEVEYSTGWETMLRGVIEAGLMIVGTWPLLSESIDTIKKGKSSLSTSVVLVCRKRPEEAGLSTRRQFITDLKRDLPEALRLMQQGSIAPVDLAQAAIGPGMSVFSRHARVLESDGTPMSVRTALQLINQTLDEVLSEQEGDFDADTRWAIAWFDQFGTDEGPFGVAETLSKAKVTSVAGLETAGIVKRVNGRVRLIRRSELDESWDPTTDKRLTIWEATQHLIRRLEEDGEESAAELLRTLGSVGDAVRDLAYRLYSAAERQGRAKEALAYNSLVVAWPELSKLAGRGPETSKTAQTELL